MSTRRDTRYAAKRRAANRKRTREFARMFFVYAFIGILIIGTVSTIFVVSAPSSSVPTPAPTSNAALGDLVNKGDASIAAGDFNAGITYYLAYSSQNAQDSDVLFKIGKAYVDPNNPSPDYLAGAAYLQRALNANPSASWAGEATNLITQFEPQAFAAATATAVAVAASPPVTGTTVTTGTAVTAPVTGTSVLTK